MFPTEDDRSHALRARTLAQVNCSFCAKPSSAVAKVIAGPGVYICNECIQLCNDILKEEQQASSGPGTQLPAREEAMTDEENLVLLPRIASVSAQTDPAPLVRPSKRPAGSVQQARAAMLQQPTVKYRPADAGHSLEHGQNPQGIWSRSPETEQMMTEASAQQPSVPAPPAPANVADIMRSAVTTVERNDHVAAAAYLMRRKSVTALVLVDAQTNRPIGLITEADLVQLMADGRDPDTVRIHELMATRLSVIKATASIRDAADTMITGRFRHLPVIDDAGLVGIVDITDICRALLGALGG